MYTFKVLCFTFFFVVNNFEETLVNLRDNKNCFKNDILITHKQCISMPKYLETFVKK